MERNISKYLTYEEGIKSQTALRRGISNEPNEEQLENMKRVAAQDIDKVSACVAGALHASSFLRSEALNAAIGGSSKTSQHMMGEAIDIDCDTFGNGTNNGVFDFIKDNLVFDQLIGEYPDASGKWSWVHVSLKYGVNRKQVLVKLKDKYIPFDQFKVGMV